MKLVLKGIAASSGVFEGKTKIIKNLNNASPTQDNGFVLVAEFITPVHTLLLLKAGAVITDEGGLMSHSAIVCREFGIPCVTGTKNATKIFKDNQLVVVNGNEGKVFSR